jgi:hypothetical protein
MLLRDGASARLVQTAGAARPVAREVGYRRPGDAVDEQQQRGRQAGPSRARSYLQADAIARPVPAEESAMDELRYRPLRLRTSISLVLR